MTTTAPPAGRVRVRPEQARGYWITDVGQRVTGWVPPGAYDHGQAVDVAGALVVALVNGRGFAWHVSAATFATLTPATH